MSPTTDDMRGSTEPIAVTVPQARRLSGLGYTTIWRLIREGTLATVRIGRRRLVLFDSLRRLLSPDVAGSAPRLRRRGRPRKAAAQIEVTG
jgi:excisionase family DNA binding protein